MKKTKRTTTFKSNNNRAVSSSDSEASIATNHILTTNQLLPESILTTSNTNVNEVNNEPTKLVQ
ncbi:unnamed protein product, partial [Rotaria magnacalcarata]